MRPINSLPDDASEIPNYPGYKADKQGNIYSCWMCSKISTQWKILLCSVGKRGYRIIRLKNDQKVTQTRYVHHLILETFVGRCPAGMEGCHNNGIRVDCRLENLRWDTRAANFSDRRKHGTNQDGERNCMARLSIKDIELIQKLSASGFKQAAIAKEFCVHQSAISRILTGKRWSYRIQEGVSNSTTTCS